MLIVRGENEPRVDAERVLVFDDVRLDRKGRIARPRGWLERHNGREGGLLLLNGRTDTRIEVAAGRLERWRLVNVASARYVRFSLGGEPFRIIGSDGGLIEEAVEATEVILPPADRAEIVTGPVAEGTALPIQSLPYDRGLGLRRKPERFGTLSVGPARPSATSLPERLRTIESMEPADAAPTREVRLGGRLSLRRGVDFLVNDEQHHHGEPVKVGELQVWDVVNETPINHPFHLHGFFLQVLDVDGTTPPPA